MYAEACTDVYISLLGKPRSSEIPGRTNQDKSVVLGSTYVIQQSRDRPAIKRVIARCRCGASCEVLSPRARKARLGKLPRKYDEGKQKKKRRRSHGPPGYPSTRLLRSEDTPCASRAQTAFES